MVSKEKFCDCMKACSAVIPAS